MRKLILVAVIVGVILFFTAVALIIYFTREKTHGGRTEGYGTNGMPARTTDEWKALKKQMNVSQDPEFHTIRAERRKPRKIRKQMEPLESRSKGNQSTLISHLPELALYFPFIHNY